MVPIGNPEGHLRVCTYFRDLNAACPKDEFPLPNIDTLVDNTIGYQMLSLMDGFSSYNQIWVTSDDEHKMPFTKTWGNYCYKVMPFRLKNVGATYQ